MGRVANYVIDLVEEILGEKAEREMRFPWTLGDLSQKTGRRAELPFDAVWLSRRVIVEVDEDQHRRPVAFWDKPDVLTVSGEQRAMYDQRKRAAARAHGFMWWRSRGNGVPSGETQPRRQSAALGRVARGRRCGGFGLMPRLTVVSSRRSRE